MLIYVELEAPAIAPVTIEKVFAHLHLVSAKWGSGLVKGDAFEGVDDV